MNEKPINPTVQTPRRSLVQTAAETALEVSTAALMTWFFFLAIQALALQLITEGF